MPSIGPLEIAIVLVIALVIFGPKRLPELGKSAGRGLREFKHSITGSDDGSDERRERVGAASSGSAEAELVNGEAVSPTRG